MKILVPIRLLMLLAIISLAACATSPKEIPDPVVERAEARWAALLEGDLETAYSYMTPGYRSSVSVIDFGVQHKLRRVRWTGARYQGHDCEDQRCSVRFEVDYSVANAVPGVPVFNHHAEHDETWIQTQGQWWFLQQ